jgi:hypothetical protein
VRVFAKNPKNGKETRYFENQSVFIVLESLFGVEISLKVLD